MRHYSHLDLEALRDWKLEACADGPALSASASEHWVELMRHTNDTALSRKGDTHTWAIPPLPASASASEGSGGVWRRFRVRQTGPNSSSHYYLALSGFEVYGRLYFLNVSVCVCVCLLWLLCSSLSLAFISQFCWVVMCVVLCRRSAGQRPLPLPLPLSHTPNPPPLPHCPPAPPPSPPLCPLSRTSNRRLPQPPTAKCRAAESRGERGRRANLSQALRLPLSTLVIANNRL